MKHVVAGLALVAALLGGAASADAQVSDEQYGDYYNFIISNVWVCTSAQPFDGVEDGELNMEEELHFQPKNSYEAYRFVGDGTETMNIDGSDYTGRFHFEGFGFNDSSFGTGVSIKTATMTTYDTAPDGWTWNDGENIQLHLVPHDDGYTLEGYQTMPGGGSITYECSGKA